MFIANNKPPFEDYEPVEITETIPHTTLNVLVYNSEVDDRPWFSYCYILILLDFLCLGWLQRWKLLSHSGKVTYNLKKQIMY